VKQQLDDLGIGLVAIGSGTPLMANNFAEEFEFTGELYVDPTLDVYKALNCSRGVKLVLGFKAMKEIKKAIGDGYKQGLTQGDGLQLGGSFLFGKNCEVLWQHLEKWAGNHADLLELIQACKTAREGKPK